MNLQFLYLNKQKSKIDIRLKNSLNTKKEISNIIIKYLNSYVTKLIFSIFLLFYLKNNSKINLIELTDIFLDRDFLLLLPLILLINYIIIFLISTRWRYLVESELRSFNFFRYYLLSNFYSLLFPSTVAVDFYKFNVNKNVLKMSKKDSFKTIVIERTLGVTVLLFFLSTFLITEDTAIKNGYTQIIYLITICLITIIFFLKKFKETFITFIIFVLDFILNYIIFLYFEIDLNFFEIGIIVFVSYLVVILPISFMGFGIREFAYVNTLSIFGADVFVGFTVALVVNLIKLITNLSGVFFKYEK